MGDLEWKSRRDGHMDYRQRPFRQPVGGRGGRKRGREEPEDSPEKIFIREVMDLGDEVCVLCLREGLFGDTVSGSCFVVFTLCGLLCVMMVLAWDEGKDGLGV